MIRRNEKVLDRDRLGAWVLFCLAVFGEKPICIKFFGGGFFEFFGYF